jgi:HEAT repeat protein
MMRKHCQGWDFLKFGLGGMLLLFGLLGALAQAPASTPAATQGKESPSAKAAPSPVVKPQNPGEKAWGILREALRDDNAEKRAKAARSLGLLPGSAEAEKAAITALQDPKANVRVAAAVVLGSMRAEHANAALEKAVEDSEPSVVLAAANSLLLLQDDMGYDIYYEVLTGERRAGKGLVKEQLDTLRDKKKVAELGFEEGIGFLPFAGIGLEIFKTVKKNDSSPVRAAAAKKLAHDPNPDSVEALLTATKDKNWTVRAAALEAIAQRGDRSLVPKVAAALDDEKDVVRFTAAARVAHLSNLPATGGSGKTSEK